jgi:hypothetical protein
LKLSNINKEQIIKYTQSTTEYFNEETKNLKLIIEKQKIIPIPKPAKSIIIRKTARKKRTSKKRINFRNDKPCK